MELIISGLGVSSMLLSRALVERKAFDRLTLVGRRAPHAAHVFSYWADRPTPFDAAVEMSWNRLQVVDALGVIPVELGRFTYRTFHPSRWLAKLTDEVLAHPGVRWIDGEVQSAETEHDRARVRLAASGEVLSADWAFVSGQLGAVRPARWQYFTGIEVELKEPVLDVEVATLLDFRTPAPGDFRFVYALPFSPTRLFVEHVSHLPSDHDAALARWLELVLGVPSWRVVEKESGATPLFATPPKEDGRVRHIGVAAGMARPCTGYALMRMWRDSEAQAESLHRWGHPRTRGRGRFLSRTADAYFLDRLAHAPDELPKLMRELFSKANGDAVLGFLDDRATLEEKRAVASAMPGWLRWWSSARGFRGMSSP
ncbi:MAG: lycopene cyclase family protein [Archangium sp.]